MRLGRPALAAALLTLAAALLLPAIAAAQPNLKYAISTPKGIAPGAPVTVSFEITTTREDKASLVFVRLFTVPVILNGENFEEVHYLLAVEFKDSAELVVSLLRDKVYSGAWDTYGYVVPVGFRTGTINRSITLKVPGNANCGDTLFIFVAYRVDESSGWLSVPVGVVCEGEWRRGIYYEDYVKQLRDENALLSSQVARLETALRSAYSEKDSLRRQLGQLQSENQQLKQQLGQLQGELSRLQGEAARLQQQLSALTGENQQLKQQLADVSARAQLLYPLAALAAGLAAALAALALRRKRG